MNSSSMNLKIFLVVFKIHRYTSDAMIEIDSNTLEKVEKIINTGS